MKFHRVVRCAECKTRLVITARSIFHAIVSSLNWSLDNLWRFIVKGNPIESARSGCSMNCISIRENSRGIPSSRGVRGCCVWRVVNSRRETTHLYVPSSISLWRALYWPRVTQRFYEPLFFSSFFHSCITRDQTVLEVTRVANTYSGRAPIVQIENMPGRWRG